ncbi:MAG: hypothetical protein ACTHV0_08220 [Lactobacillus helveticus]|uniref:Surface layer protein A domain-containing protein n=1 Tax=Lactobacillus helveticus TaxID=1587 RepID=A0AAV4E497_LACHE|nr:hypothetical protein [Lactobacillus helveticus]AJY61210.1 hypothetical protein HUO_04590 [Lactobacillus helveticus]AUJ27951.1 hypothetical protein Lh8627_05830 [Lactobacillus helveticus]AZA21447.1 MAG: hypothetical protein DQL94_03970 [Lactobacillus helveticus]MBW7980544.1 hypothetical protein [Lactobacillus helveticus]MCS8612508.1 hypothetical protein [Lactobacillus helveticus]
MKTKKLFTSIAAAVMLSTSLAGSGAVLSQTAHAANTTQTTTKNSNDKKGTVSVKRRSVTVTINSDKPTLLAVGEDGKSVKPVASTYTKGQTIQVYYSVAFTATAQGSEGHQLPAYYVENKEIDGKESMIFIPAGAVTAATAVPSQADWVKQAESDAKAIQEAYQNRDLKYIVVTPKSKKGAKIYYAYKKTRKSKKVYFKATKKKIKKGKKYKSSMIVKHGKTRYVYIGKKRYVKLSALKMVSAKYAPVKLSDDLKSLIIEN